MKKIHHLGACPLTDEPCIITAEYREEFGFHNHRHIRVSAECSLGPCEHAEACREFSHFPPEYGV